MDWYPHPGPQREFCESGEFEVLFGGAAGPGKTDCLIMEATRYVNHPSYRGLIIRRTFPQLQEIIDRCHLWYPKIDDQAYYKATEHRWYWPSGATIQLGHMQHENDKYNYQGKQYHFIGVDEVTQFTETQYKYLFSRCRTVEPDIKCRVRATTNPGGVGHKWCLERFVNICTPGTTFFDKTSGLSRKFIPAKLTDNPTLIDTDPEYVSRLLELPEIERQRLLDGKWDVFEGQAFVELSMLVHGIEPFEIPYEWERFISFDWGYSAPYSVGWYAIDFDGILYRYRELYGCNDDWAKIGVRGRKELAEEVARKIRDIEEKAKEKIRFRVADPACWNKRPRKDGTKGPSVIEDMAHEGVYFLKADNERVLGKQQVHKRLKIEEKIDKETGEVLEEFPRCYIFKDHVHFWRTMPNLILDTKNDEDVDTNQEDHIYDEFRYACMARPIKPTQKPRTAPGSFKAERARMIRARKLAQHRGISFAQAYRMVR